MRIILYTGKGGVGKTSVAAATAVGCARRGYRTVVMSTDAAHSLSDSLGRELEPGLNEVADGLWAEEISVNEQIKAHWGAVQTFFTEFLSRQGFERLLAEELAILPGMEELFNLLKISRYQEDGRFDVVVVDCAPTASTIRMLSFPDMIRWYMKKLFHIERRILTTIKPIVERVSDLILPDNNVYDTFESLFEKAGAMKDVLADAKTCTCRLVANAERMVLAESQRAFTYLNLFGYTVDGIFVNKLLPDGLTDPFWSKWKDLQREVLAETAEKFEPLPLFRIEQFDREMVGLDLLAQMCKMTFGDEDPTRIFLGERATEFEATEQGFRLSLTVPFADRDDIELFSGPEELAIQIGSFRRNVLLPRSVASRKVAGAKVEDGRLHVFFEGDGSDDGR